MSVVFKSEILTKMLVAWTSHDPRRAPAGLRRASGMTTEDRLLWVAQALGSRYGHRSL